MTPDRGTPQKREAQSFSEHLEARARLVSSGLSKHWEVSSESVLERQIALTLDHLSQAQKVKTQAEESLLRSECSVLTEILQHSTPYYGHKHDRLIRDHLRHLHESLEAIEHERRQLSVDHARTLQSLHDRLLDLLDTHARLT